MKRKSQRYAGSRDVKFQATLENEMVTIIGFVGKCKASDSYSFPLASYPSHPYDRKQFMDQVYRTFEQECVGQASRHTDAMIRATNELVEAV